MDMKGVLLAAMMAAVSGAWAAAHEGETELCRGGEPSFSPDGREILFQRRNGGRMCIGAYSLAERRERWVWRGERGDALWPEWGPDGSVLCVYGDEPETAYQAWKANKQTGFNVARIGRDGAIRLLTTGRCFDLTPCWSPDLKTVYYSSTAGLTEKSGDGPDGAAVMCVPAEGGAPTTLIDPKRALSGMVDFKPSPDGRHFAWAEIDGFGEAEAWHIVVAKAGDLASGKTVTPERMSAYSPAWRPDGQALAFTGYQEGDGGWRIYTIDFRQDRKLTRIASGKNPSFSPDGRSLVYERDGMIYRKEVAK